MTRVIETTTQGAYPDFMEPKTSAELDRLMTLQRSLEARTAGLTASATDVLKVGRAVLEFAEREEAAFFPLLPLLDPAAKAELGDEHEQLANDLELLQWLVTTTPDSPDIPTLAEAIGRRMRNHIARDGRLLTQAGRMANL